MKTVEDVMKISASQQAVFICLGNLTGMTAAYTCSMAPLHYAFLSLVHSISSFLSQLSLEDSVERAMTCKAKADWPGMRAPLLYGRQVCIIR